MRTELQRLVELDREQNLAQRVSAILGWDQETYLPPKGVEERAEQLAFMDGLAHGKLTRPEIGELLAALGSTSENPLGDPGLDERERTYLRALRRAYDQATRLPAELVSEFSRETSLAQAAWAQARAKNDFPAFAPHLAKILELNKRRAACLDPSKKAYDVLLDLFEPGSDEESVAAVFRALRGELVTLLGKIRSRPQVDDSALRRNCPAERQAAISRWIMGELSFDPERGRLDTTAHPFTTALGRHDVRITTRYLPEYMASSLFSTMHETGHALYELGIDPGEDFARTRLAEASSAGIHESQSRLWENLVGRSMAFWTGRYPKLASLAGESLGGVGLEAFFRAINKVEPSMIRTEADEVTYSLHVILRFEIEAELLSGRLSVAELPAAWNGKMRELLGVAPPDDARGCLQDIHWSLGYMGYFPSYALGNLYAAQFWDAMRKATPDLEKRVEGGELGPILGWLRANIHGNGAACLPDELVLRVTGSALDPEHFLSYLNGKYALVYGF